MTEPHIPNVGGSFENRGVKQPLPNSTEVMVLGIVSIVICWCWGFFSFIIGIITIVLANQGERLYRSNPGVYTEVSYRNMRTGKTCAIIGLCLAGITIIGVIIYFVIFGTIFLNAFKNGAHY